MTLTVTAVAPSSVAATQSLSAPSSKASAVSTSTNVGSAVAPSSVTAEVASAPSTPVASVSFTSGPQVDTWGARVDQATPSASWDIVVPPSIGRVPVVAIYLASGELVFADVVASSTHVYITFPSPYAGFVILT